MSTDISVSSTSYEVERRNWLLSSHGTDPGATPSITLAVSTFTAADHYPTGFVKSGTVLGQITATGLYGPYDPAAVDGRQTAAGLLFSLAKIPNLLDLTKNVGGAMVVHGFVRASKLPVQTGTGSLDAAAQTALRLVHVSA